MGAPRPAEERFWEKVNKMPDGCWVWTASLKNGYGNFGVSHGEIVYVHRQSYEWAVGPIPDGLTIDHLCRNKLCVNPAHLEVVTRAENARREVRDRPKRSHCLRGHEFTKENTRVNRKGARECRICVKQREAK